MVAHEYTRDYFFHQQVSNCGVGEDEICEYGGWTHEDLVERIKKLETELEMLR